MRTIACLSMLPTTPPALGCSESDPHTATAPDEPTEAEHSVTPETIGIALAWLAFFVIAIEQALTTSYGDALPNVLMRLH